MKSFNQFYSEAIVLAKKGGVEGKLDKSTGKFTAGNFSDAERARYTKYSAKPAATTTRAVAPAPRPAAPTTRPAPVASRPAPKKDERPTNRQVAAARREAEYQRNARNLRLGAELGGIAAKQAQQNYATQNSPAVRAAKAKMAADNAGTWRTHQFTLDSPAPTGPKNRDYGIPDFVSDRRRENRGAMYDQLRSDGMSPAAARKEAARREAELHGKNMQYMKNRRFGYQG
tara:strand:- start:398 stop:1084 length:687 start_codon:yes stop_codon:yes gene_type:complete